MALKDSKDTGINFTRDINKICIENKSKEIKEDLNKWRENVHEMRDSML